MTADLRDRSGRFRRAFDEHHRDVYAAAFRRRSATRRWPRTSSRTCSCACGAGPAAFDPARGDLGTYLRLMARSRALDLWREGQVRGRAADRLKLVGGAESRASRSSRRSSPSATQDRAEVREALGKLPEAQREAIVLAYWGGLTADQIARRAHVPLGTAKSRHPARAGAPARRVRRRCVVPRTDSSGSRLEHPRRRYISNTRSVKPSRERTECSRVGDP